MNTNTIFRHVGQAASLSFAPLKRIAQVGALAAVAVVLAVTNAAAQPGGTSAKFQVRAWSGGYATYEKALPHAGILIGQSAVIVNPTGDPWGSPPAPPVSLLAGGLASFTLTTNAGPAQPPTLTCASNKTVQCGTAWAFDAPTAVDGCTSNSLPVYVLNTTTNGQCPQLIARTWAATNSCDTNYTTCSQLVTVVDTDRKSTRLNS